jgi:hypothetical protein
MFKKGKIEESSEKKKFEMTGGINISLILLQSRPLETNLTVLLGLKDRRVKKANNERDNNEREKN